MKTPVVFYAGNTVIHPGETVGVRGEYFDLIREAYLVCEGDKRPATLLDWGRQSFKVRIPVDFPVSTYTLLLVGDGFCCERHLNTPKVRWLQGNHGKSASANGWFRVFGECLRLSNERLPTAKLVSDTGSVWELTAAHVYDDYSVRFDLPRLENGIYTVTYDNGYSCCVSDDYYDDHLTLHIATPWSDAWPNDIYNVVEWGFPCDCVTDCTDKLRELLQTVSEKGGGVVYFPRGRYHLTGTFRLPKGVTLRGDGYTKSQIFWSDTWFERTPKEDGGTQWSPTQLPDVMIEAEGDNVLEDLDFSAARIGSFIRAGSTEQPIANLYIRRVRIYANAFGGSHLHARFGGYNYPSRCAVMKETLMNKTDLFCLLGENIQIDNCKFQWSGRPFSHDGKMTNLLLQNTAFLGTTAVDDWMPIGTLQDSVIEDCEIYEWTTGCGGNNVYFARVTMRDVVDNNREAFTTDITTGIDYHETAVMDGVRCTFPDTVDMTKAKIGSVLCILSGTGAGQYRYVTAKEGQTVIVDRPFLAIPDETSHFTINGMFVNWYFVNNVLDNSGTIQFYTAQGNSVVDGTKVTRSGGLQGWGHFVYGGVGNNWYNSYVNNDFSDGNYYHMGGWYSSNCPGSSFIKIGGVGGDDITNLACVVRNNSFQENCLIHVIGCQYSGTVMDTILEGNRFTDCRGGIFIEGKPTGVLLHNNSFTNVDKPLSFSEQETERYYLATNI